LGHYGLGCGAENGGDVVVAKKFANGEYAGAQKFWEETLCFIKNDDAVDDVMELSASTGSAGIK